jgi:hypothetical protein
MNPKEISMKRLEEGDTVYLYVHKESYNSFDDSKATASLFVKRKDQEKIEYCYSLCEIPMKEGKFLYGYVCTYSFGTKIKIGIPFYYAEPTSLTKITIPF